MKKILSLICLVIFSATIFSSCGVSGKNFHLEQKEVKKIIATEKNFILLDVRTEEEYRKKHIPNSLLLPIDEIKAGNFEKVLPDKNQKILIYCWTGRRAEDSAKILIDNGYKNVFEFGGLVDWTGEVVGSEVDER